MPNAKYNPSRNFFRKHVGSQTKSTRHSSWNRQGYTTNHKRSAALVCVRRGSWTICDRTLSQTVIVGKRVRWSLAWQTGYAEISCATGHKSHTVHMLARVPYILFPKRFVTTDRMVSLRHYKRLITDTTRAKEFSVCIAHDYILQGLWIIAPYPWRFLGRVGRTPPIAHTHLATVPNVVAERG